MLHVEDDEVEVRGGELAGGVQGKVVDDGASDRFAALEFLDGPVQSHRGLLGRDGLHGHQRHFQPRKGRGGGSGSEPAGSQGRITPVPSTTPSNAVYPLLNARQIDPVILRTEIAHETRTRGGDAVDVSGSTPVVLGVDMTDGYEPERLPAVVAAAAACHTIHMKRTNLVLDETLLEEALQLSAQRTYSKTVELALSEFVRRARAGKILALAGAGLWDGDLSAMRRDAPKRAKRPAKHAAR